MATARSTISSGVLTRKGNLNGHILFVAVATLCLLVSPTASLTNDIQELLNNIDQSDDAKVVAEQPIMLQNALHDVRAVVGKLFRMTIPEDTFKGDVQKITVSEGSGESLPLWLVYDGKTHTLSGVPSHEDLGQHYIQVKAEGATADAMAQDVFSIGVVESSGLNKVGESSGNLQPISCQHDDAITMVTVIVDTDLSKQSAEEKINLLSQMTKHLKLGEDFLTMLPVGNKPLYDKTALVAGPGDTAKPNHPGAFISWTIGCGSVNKDHLKILENVESSSKDGVMSQAVGHPIVGWHVTSNKRSQPQRRLKRQSPGRRRGKIAATATPVGPQPPPTSAAAATVDVEKTKVVIEPTRVQVMSTMAPEPSSMEMSVVPTPEPTPMRTSDAMVTVKPTKAVIMPSHPVTTPEPSMMKTTPKMAEPTPEPSTPEPKTEPPYVVTNTKPEAKNPIEQLPATVGKVFRYRFKKNLFHDMEDGDTRHLALLLSTVQGEALPKNFWLSYNQKRQEMLGLPMKKHVGTHEFVLTAMDSEQAMQRMSFDIVVSEPPAEEEKEISHEFAMTLNVDYDTFMSDINMQLDFLKKLSGLFGDKNGNSLTITRIERGSVIISWTNNSMASDTCPVNDISQLLDKLMESDGTFKPEMLEKMKPFVISDLALEPKGSCTDPENGFQPITRAPVTTIMPTTVPMPTDGGKEGESKDEDDDLLIKVVPAVVIIALLLIAGIIACVLYRKKKQGKMTTEDQHTFINKGIPIIFADELEDKPDQPTRPLIMEDEKPPQMPPAYHRSATNSPHSTPPSDHKQPILDDPPEDDVDVEDETVSPPYHPPEPPVGTDSTLPRPNTEPNYQPSPPPYVPP